MNRSPTWFRRLSVGTLAWNLAVILWGAYVRATGSGAGCGDHWPLCNGEVVPRSPSATTLIEFTHRATSGVALLAVLALCVAAFRAHPKAHPVRRAATLSLGFILLEAALGAGLVLLELVAHDASVRRAVAMSLHLVNTFLLLAALAQVTWYALAGGTRLRWRAHPTLAPLAALSAGLLVAVGVSGAIAALGDTLTQAQVRTPLVELLLRLRVLHPVLAVGAALALFAFAPRAWAASGVASARWAAGALMGVLLLQLGAGVVNVLLLAPVWMQLVHLLLADLTWVTFVWASTGVFGGAAPEHAGVRAEAPAPQPASAAG